MACLCLVANRLFKRARVCTSLIWLLFLFFIYLIWFSYSCITYSYIEAIIVVHQKQFMQNAISIYFLNLVICIFFPFNLQTLLCVIQYNDNNGNTYSDVFWLAAMVQSVGELEFERQVFHFLQCIVPVDSWLFFFVQIDAYT